MRLLLLSFFSICFACNCCLADSTDYHLYEKVKTKREKKSDSTLANQDALNLRADCKPYLEELKEMALSPDLVKTFREDYLLEHYQELLKLYSEFWNHVYHVWFNADESDKKVITDFRRDWRQKLWYFKKKKDHYAELHATMDLKDQYRGRFQKFAKKYFDTEPFDERGWGLQVRHGKNNLVFPWGSVIELDDGELMVSRYSKIRLPKEMGGFILHLRISNDIYASKIKVVAQKENFHWNQAAMPEVLASARKWASVDEEDPDFDRDEDRLDLLLDERFERCYQTKEAAASTAPNPPSSSPSSP